MLIYQRVSDTNFHTNWCIIILISSILLLFIWLVVCLPSWKMMEFVNGVGMTSHIWWKIIQMVETTSHQPAFIDWDFPIKKPSICWVSPWLMFFWCRMVTGPQFPTTTLFQQMIWTTHFVESSSIMLGFPHLFVSLQEANWYIYIYIYPDVRFLNTKLFFFWYQVVFWLTD